MTKKLSWAQRRALEKLERGAPIAAAHPATIEALRLRGLIDDHPRAGYAITDAGRARLHPKLGRKPGSVRQQIAKREFLARQLELPLEVPR
jgi:DNA-binding PadR family transcriptional regulator